MNPGELLICFTTEVGTTTYYVVSFYLNGQQIHKICIPDLKIKEIIESYLLDVLGINSSEPLNMAFFLLEYRNCINHHNETWCDYFLGDVKIKIMKTILFNRVQKISLLDSEIPNKS